MQSFYQIVFSLTEMSWQIHGHKYIDPKFSDSDQRKIIDKNGDPNAQFREGT